MPEPATRQANLTQHRRQRNPHPDRLLAIRRSLERPTHRNERSLRGHLASEVTIRSAGTPEMPSAQARSWRRHRSRPADSARTCHTRAVKRSRNARSCRPSVTSVCAMPSMTATSDPGLVGTHSAGTSARSSLQRAERHEAHAIVRGGVQIRAHLMRGHAPGADEGVLDGQSAEGHHHLRVIDDLLASWWRTERD